MMSYVETGPPEFYTAQVDLFKTHLGDVVPFSHPEAMYRYLGKGERLPYPEAVKLGLAEPYGPKRIAEEKARADAKAKASAPKPTTKPRAKSTSKKG